MNRNDFLCSLERLLSDLPDKDRMTQLSYYSEIISDMTEDGLSENDALEKLGTPEEISAEIHSQIPPVVKVKHSWTPLSITLTAAGSPLWFPIALVLICVLVAIYIAIWCVVVALFAVVLSIGLAALAALVTGFLLIFKNAGETLFMLGCALLLAGLTVLAFLGSFYTAKALIKLTRAIWRCIKKLFKRKEC